MDVLNRLSLYRAMLRIRIVEERIAKLYPEQEMRCPVHLCIGQEAAQAGTALALENDDLAISGHRSHGHYLAKGGNLNAMLAELYGKATGSAGGKGGSMHLVDLDAGFLGATPIVGSSIPIGVGAALNAQIQGINKVVMIYFGDGAAEAGVFYESLNFAKLKNLPVVFVCENNLYSVYSPMSVRQPSDRTITELARSHGIESHSANGNLVETVYELSRNAVDSARSGKGPVFLELATYRFHEHCGPEFDNHIGYRTEEEFKAWKKKDPLLLYRDELISTEDMVDSQFDAMEQELHIEMDKAVAFAKSSPFPDIWAATTNVYATGQE